MSAPTITRPDQITLAAQRSHVGAGSDFDSGHVRDGTHSTDAAVEPLSSSGQLTDDTQSVAAVAGPTSPQVTPDTTPRLRTPAGTNLPESTNESTISSGRASAQEQTGSGSATTIDLTAPISGASLSDPFLALAADVLDDTERSRIANENRLRQLTRSETDSDGEDRGFGLDESHPDVARLAALVDMLKQIEHQAGLNLNRLLRQHPLGPWVKAQKGIGEKQAARLLAVVGDPYVNEQTGEIRTVSQLWSYCGHGDPARRKFKGMTQADLFTLGNPTAKSRTWLIACAVLKAQGPLVVTYYDRKAATEGRLHAAACVRCGPSGKPATEGSPWSDAHRHADALRVLGKRILRDMWREAERLHNAAVP